MGKALAIFICIGGIAKCGSLRKLDCEDPSLGCGLAGALLLKIIFRLIRFKYPTYSLTDHSERTGDATSIRYSR